MRFLTLIGRTHLPPGVRSSDLMSPLPGARSAFAAARTDLASAVLASVALRRRRSDRGEGGACGRAGSTV